MKRRGSGGALGSAILVAATLLLGTPAGGTAAERPGLVIDSVTVTGNTRTAEEVIHRLSGLSSGDTATPDEILLAVERLRRSGLFESVRFDTRRGTIRGHVVLDLDVREKGVEFGLGAGYRDLSGWYLIPAELRLDNRLGRGERTRVQLKLGYRLAGLAFSFEESGFGDGRNHWGFIATTFRHDRRYFVESTEFGIDLDRSGVEAHVGRQLGRRWGVEFGAGVERVEVDSIATAKEKNELLAIDRGDERTFDELPPGVAGGVGEERRLRVRFDLVRDSRSERLVAGTAAGGLWARARWEGFLGDDRSYAVGTADLRGYASAGPLSFACLLRGGAASRQAPFFDRFYVGGLYTVRGFPSQSLSAPGGEGRFWSASFEMRAPLIGARADPRLAGLLFVDAGEGWNDGDTAKLDDAALSAGYGLRCRLPWIGYAGLDVGFPISESPVEEAVHVNFSLGWTF